MSRLSLKPGGEPGVWIVEGAEDDSDPEMTYYRGFTATDVLDSDLLEIQRTLAEYFAAKEPVAEKKPKTSLMTALFAQRGYVYIAGWILLGVAITGFLYGWNRVPAQSTGGVVDSLCMRPEVECATTIRYLHPQKDGIVEREYDTFPTAKNEARMMGYR